MVDLADSFFDQSQDHPLEQSLSGVYSIEYCCWVKRLLVVNCMGVDLSIRERERERERASACDE